MGLVGELSEVTICAQGWIWMQPVDGVRLRSLFIDDILVESGNRFVSPPARSHPFPVA